MIYNKAALYLLLCLSLFIARTCFSGEWHGLWATCLMDIKYVIFYFSKIKVVWQVWIILWGQKFEIITDIQTDNRKQVLHLSAPVSLKRLRHVSLIGSKLIYQVMHFGHVQTCIFISGVSWESFADLPRADKGGIVPLWVDCDENGHQ